MATNEGTLISEAILVNGNLEGDEDVTVRGRFEGTLGTEVFADRGNFIAKLSGVDGAVSWVTRLDETAEWYVRGIDTDTAGRVYLAGDIRTTPFVLGDDELTLYGTCSGPPDPWCYSDALVVRLTSAGEPDWAANLGSSVSENGYGLAVHGASRFVTYGDFYSTSWSLGSFTLTGSGDSTDRYYFLASVSVD